MVHPHTKAASCYFGRGTRWCVSATVSKNHFNEYAAGNNFLYFILSKEPTIADLEKIAYNIEKRNDVNRIDIFNSLDELINEEEVEDYLGEKFNIIKSAIIKHKNSHEETAANKLIQRLTPEDVEKQLKEIKNWKEEEELEDLFWGSYKTPGDIIRVLYNNMKSKRRFDSKDGKHDLRLVAFHPNTPSDVLIDIFLNYKRHLDLRHFIEYSKAVSSEVLKFIFFHSDLDYLRPLIISHYKLLSSDLKEIIPLIKIEDIRKLTKTPTENNIEVLLRFSDLDIRYELIQMFHDKIPYHILNELASDSDDKTRYLIATHTYDLDILKRLAKDPVRYVSLAAQYRIKYNPDLYR